jgi:putative transposase
MNLRRSTYYYRATDNPEGPSSAAIMSIIEGIRDELPCYGYRRETHELRRHGFIVNHKRVGRVTQAQLSFVREHGTCPSSGPAP